MDDRRATSDQTLEERISYALLQPADQDLDQLDRLLTDCAAEILQLRERRIDAEREVRNLTARWERLSALMANLRQLRDRAAEPARARFSPD
jgi:flagellar biosynthesis/type III secretory pathway chaperone